MYMYTRKYDISVVCSLQLHVIVFILLMSVRFSQRKYLNFTIKMYLQTSFRTLQYNIAFNISQGDVLVCFSTPFFDVT